MQEDRVRIPVVRIFKEISQIAGLLGAERLAVIVRLELIEHRELTDLVERDTRQLMWHDRWKEPLFVASHVVKGRDRRVKVPGGTNSQGAISRRFATCRATCRTDDERRTTLATLFRTSFIKTSTG